MSGQDGTDGEAPTHGYTVPGAPWQPPAAVVPPHLPPLAGLGRRVAARLVDYVLLVPVMVGMWWGFFGLADRLVPDGGDPPAPFVFGYLLATVAVPAVVEWLQLVARGRTVGKTLLGLRVVPLAPGAARLSAGRAAARAFFFPGLAYVVPCSVAWIFVVALITLTNGSLRQGLHDQVARSVVVAAR